MTTLPARAEALARHAIHLTPAVSIHAPMQAQAEALAAVVLANWEGASK